MSLGVENNDSDKPEHPGHCDMYSYKSIRNTKDLNAAYTPDIQQTIVFLCNILTKYIVAKLWHG